MNRRALPNPVINDFKQEYVAPKDEIENQLCESFAKALNIDKTTISVKDDFYKLGGDSIATMLVVVNTDSLDISAKDIFKYKTIEKLADIVRLRKQNQSEPLDKQLENELRIPHMLNQMQVTMFDYQLYKVKSTMWNLPVYHRYEKSVNIDKLKKAVEQVVKAHPALSFIIRFNENHELVFDYKPEMMPETDIVYSTEEQMREMEKDLVKPFRLIKTPLFRSRIFVTEEYNYLFLDLHHIIGDGTTITIILRDLEKAYFNEPLEKDYYPLELANIEKNKNNIQQNKEYFDTNYSGIDWYSIPEPDFKTRDTTKEDYEELLSINENQLETAEKKYSVSRNVIAIAAGLIALAKYSGKNNVLTNWIYDNRTTKLSKNYVGLMIKAPPVGVNFDKIKNNSELLEEVKKQVNEGIQNCDYDYFTEYEQVFTNDCMEINYVGNIDFQSINQRLTCESISLDTNHDANARLGIDLWNKGNGAISVEATYVAKIYKKESIDRFIKLYIEAFEELVKGKTSNGL